MKASAKLRCLHDASVTAGPLDHRSNAVLRRPREGRASREGRDAPRRTRSAGGRWLSG